jgi:hypothetical protein
MSDIEEQYPTDDFLLWIRTYRDYENMDVWFDRIHDAWWMPDWGWHEKDGKDVIMRDIDGNKVIYHIREYKISTGGWSGNEDIIDAMQSNITAWHKCFFIHRVGGHYVLKVHKEVSR